MRILILGAGVVGVTSAWYLARAGHEVVVLDRQPAAALETSFGNAGQISPGYASPWAGPGVPAKAVKWLLQKHPPLSLQPDGTLFQVQWLTQMLANCSAKRDAYAVQQGAHGAACRNIAATASWRCAARPISPMKVASRAQLQVFRTQKQMDGSAKDHDDVLKEMGVPYELLSRDELARAEPALEGSKDKLVGGLRLPGDETGDCHGVHHQTGRDGASTARAVPVQAQHRWPGRSEGDTLKRVSVPTAKL